MDWNEYYTPFGESLINNAANDNQSGFTGHIKDADTGLNYMQARYYDANSARFLSIDPVTFMQTGDPRFFNRYAYTFNDPINLVDRLGTHPTGTHPKYNQPKPRKSLKEEFSDIGNAIAGTINEIKNVLTNDADEPAGPFEQDDVGKIKNIDDVDIEGLTPEELLEGEQQLEEDKEQRQREQDRNPRGSRNGSREDRENHRQHQKHQDRIKKHDKVRERVKERSDETLPRE